MPGQKSAAAQKAADEIRTIVQRHLETNPAIPAARRRSIEAQLGYDIYQLGQNVWAGRPRPAIFQRAASPPRVAPRASRAETRRSSSCPLASASQQGVSPMISPGRLWWLLRRDLKRGWKAAYHDYQTLPRIEDWRWTYWAEKPGPVPIHILTGAKDWRLAIWMLASFFHFTESAWPLIVHDDGTLTDEGRETLRRLFRACG
jgi:hypothetical protein